MAKINHVTTVEPPYSYTTAELRAEFERRWFPDLPTPVRRKMQKLFEAGQIERRCSVVPLDLVLSGAGLGERNEMYRRAMIELGRQALAKALEESGTSPDEIGAVISTSCTGFMIPSVDAYLVDLLGLPGDVLRLPVTEMGCAGGTSGLIYARSLAGSLPGKKIALLSLEAPSLTFLRNDHTAENLVSASIFADG
ncbi:MAG: type III polyketide synthase, partial [Polyangiaceae bacterium]|nr:type III polyketide synthase [Polyangiaceae bacterium]